MRRAAAVLTLVLGGVLLTASAAPAAPAVCRAHRIQQKLVDAGKLEPDSARNGEIVDLVRCGDVTDDGNADALFTVASGGTAGDTRFGVLRGRADGSLGALVLYRQGYKIGVARHNRRSFDVIQPHYKAGEPNCCPSSFRMRRYTWTGARFKAGKARKLKTVPKRFYRRAALAHHDRAPDLGPNVRILDPSMSTSQIKAIVDPIAAQQVPDQFGSRRYALLFKPGTYGSPEDPLNFEVGYYTDVAGLGASPNDVTVNGTIDVYNQCESPNNCVALVNFWRSLSNLTIKVAGKAGCQVGEFWATSQAAPMRRMHVDGPTTFMDYCTPPSFASGGFVADSQFTNSTVVNGSQQQYLVRDSELAGWSNGVWNQVFAGVHGAPAQAFPNPPYTTLATNPRSREKPYLTIDAHGRYSVFVPDARTDSSGTTWSAGATAGRSLPIERFFIARPSDSVRTINRALGRGQNLLFTPGVYAVDRTIGVKRPGTVVLGLGMATLDARDGAVPMTVADPAGVEISGLIFDAGPVSSPLLLQVGSRHGGHRVHRGGQPTALHDVFFRIGGPHVGKARVSLEVNADGAILDDIWAWRADHGNGVGWTTNTADTGVVVNGDDVVATGLFVEHYQRYEVIWNGENGKTVMFQNEMPYDPPDQAAYRHDGLLGWASYKVAPWVRTHEGWGLGSYSFFNVDPTIHASHAFEVPVRPGVRLHDILSLSITNHGTIDHVVNDFGPPTAADTTPSNVVEYPPG